MEYKVIFNIEYSKGGNHLWHADPVQYYELEEAKEALGKLKRLDINKSNIYIYRIAKHDYRKEIVYID